jgi:hypothetical protein
VASCGTCYAQWYALEGRYHELRGGKKAKVNARTTLQLCDDIVEVVECAAVALSPN